MQPAFASQSAPAAVSDDFREAVDRAIRRAQQHDDPQVRYAAHFVPVYMQRVPTWEQMEAGGCTTCVYLGLWADRWPGYPDSYHGTIWLFESGIRAMSRPLSMQTYDTLIHEIDHALGRDHVLESLRELAARGLTIEQAAAWANQGQQTGRG